MVFTSIPAAYLDAANWQQQQQNHHHHHQHGSTSQQQLLPPPPPPPQPPQPHCGGNTGSIRPGSMADRARMANLPMPETALKCPRCESTNTKFCYFNNYSLSQPRHFCKTCRRYWTRGGALRSVPVGGGCRRNKRSKGSNSNSNSNNSSTKSPANSDRQAGSTPSSINSISSNNTVSASDTLGFAPLRFMAPLHHHQHQVQLNDFGTGDLGLIYGPNYDPNYGPIGGELGNGLDQWRMPMPIPMPVPVPLQQQQFPFLEGSQTTNLYPFETSGSSNHNHYEAFTGGYMRPKVISTSGVITQLASVKMEDSNINKELNLSSSHFLGISSINNNQASEQQYWTNVGAGGGNSAAWNDISSFSSSSNTSNHM